MSACFCKYCHSEIQWENRKPMNLDGSHHSFEFCQTIKKAAKLAKAREDRAVLREQKAKWNALLALAPVGSFLVAKRKNPYSGEEYYETIGRVDYHIPFSGRAGRPLDLEHWKCLSVQRPGAPIGYNSFPPTMMGVEVVSEERYYQVRDEFCARMDAAMGRGK